MIMTQLSSEVAADAASDENSVKMTFSFLVTATGREAMAQKRRSPASDGPPWVNSPQTKGQYW